MISTASNESARGAAAGARHRGARLDPRWVRFSKGADAPRRPRTHSPVLRRPPRPSFIARSAARSDIARRFIRLILLLVALALMVMTTEVPPAGWTPDDPCAEARAGAL